MDEVYQQLDSGVRFDWGLAGAQSLAMPTSCLVIVDVLSFTTSVSVATSRGTSVFPYRWRDSSAAAFATRHHAMLAVDRISATPENPWSLSPEALLNAPVVPRLVLPSPNGSTISAASEGVVVAACLRNADAVVSWLINNNYGTPDSPIVVIAAGEHWPEQQTLRPALEDLLGAGCVMVGLEEAGYGLSPEARAAAAAFQSTRDLTASLSECASGRELARDGFARDIEVAAAINADKAVPRLRQGAFIDAA